jgi:RimJ/RimL family protein N-acetyltransferase
MKMKKQTEKVVFLSGKKVNLRPRDKEKDLEKVLVWINDQEIIRFMNARFPSTRLEEEEWLRKIKENDVHLAIETKKGLLIGGIGLHQIDFLSGKAEVGIMIGDKNYQSKGFGFDAEMILLNYGFNQLNLGKISHPAFLLNYRSVALAKKCGGIKEGILRRHVFKNGKYLDMVIISIFKNRWQRIWEEYNEEGDPPGGFEH